MNWIRRLIWNAVKRNDIFPLASLVHVDHPERVMVGEDVHIFNTLGSFFAAAGGIDIGSGTYIGPNVGLITQNHDQTDLSKFTESKKIIIGEHCWIGMNCVVLPGVVLGDCVIVGAGAIVTKSFPDGNCTIVGNPANIV